MKTEAREGPNKGGDEAAKASESHHVYDSVNASSTGDFAGGPSLKRKSKPESAQALSATEHLTSFPRINCTNELRKTNLI
mmetsp:Transcript_25968/g.64902  ORF Transcript_25968/g.64902 Transcript_25968/m.64902 type:complete len:80 (-) Transcript_25968:389-628(-)